MTKTFGLGVASAVFASALVLAGTASAGNIVLTGHDNDFHETFGSSASTAAFTAEVAFVRNGSALPVLTFDAGTELTGTLTALGVPFFNVDPSNASNITAGLFDHSVYSAFIVASVQTCGGCDNPVGSGSNIATQLAAITNFFNAGGGILGLAGASDPLAYAYVPTSATNPGGSPPSSGYVQTAFGASLGIGPVNGDPTHNFFNEPGTGGLSSAYGVVERLGDPNTGTPETIALNGGTIVCTGPDCVIHGSVPEPTTMGIIGLGLAGLAFIRRWRSA